MSVRVGLMIEGQEGVTWDQWVALARACERLELDGLYRSDHYNSLAGDESRDATDAWTLLAALGAVTDRLRLGTLVSPVTFRHPSVLAKAIATADSLAPGRVELGLGAGWNQREHEAYGFPFPPVATRMALLEEQTEIIHRQWTQDRVDFEGAHYRLTGLSARPRPATRPRIILGGTAGPRGARLAARFADEYNVVGVGPASLPERVATLHQACERQGRDPVDLTVSVMTGCVVATSSQELRTRARRVLEALRRPGDPDELLREHGDQWVVGTPEQARDQLGRLGEAGAQRVMLQHRAHDDLDMVELIGRELVGRES